MNDHGRSACLALALSGLLTGCDGCDESTQALGGSGGGGGTLPAGGSPPVGGDSSQGGSSDGGGGIDAGGSGGEGGAAAQPTMVTITVLGDPGGVPLVDVPVLASTTDGELSDETTTSATGTAVIVQPEGGFVSVLHQYAAASQNDGAILTTPTRDVRSFHLTGESAALEVHVPLDAVPSPAVTGMNLSFEVEDVAGADQYEILLSCNYREQVDVGQVFIDGYAACGGQPFDAILTARGAGSDDILLDYAFLEDVPFEDGADLVLSLPFVGNPLATFSQSVSFAAGQSYGVFSFTSGGAQTDPILISALEADVITSPLALALPQPTAYGARWCGLAVFTAPSDTSSQRIACDDAPLGNLVLNPDSLGSLSAELQAGTISFTVANDGPQGDGVEFSFSAPGATPGNFVSWQVFHYPAASGTLRFPDLPVALAAFGPDLDGLFGRGLHVRFADDIGGDYMQFVATLLDRTFSSVGDGYEASSVLLGF